MKYHIYFHDDFDGTACAALMSNFLSSRGDGVASFNPIDYVPGLKKQWLNYKFKRPFILVDFMYHPKADWWFDHHVTSFLKPEWQKGLKNDPRHYFDPSYKSVYGMTLNFLKRKYKYKPPKQLNDLEHWADIIDSASYKTAKEGITFRSTAQKLMLLLGNYEKVAKTGYGEMQLELVKTLAEGKIYVFLKKYKKHLLKLKDKLKKGVLVFKKYAILKGKVVVLSEEGLEIIFKGFLGYYIFPKAEYAVTVSKDSSGFHLHVGRNPWLKKESNLSIGDLMKKYGGGGHKNVGGAETKNYKEALKISNEIVEHLNSND
ncbi:MAG: hypothetical protein HYX21_04110 [Candidatus Yanofskybacteria bacterium]|nr:hypothetical protein [Candidatus Yanofskybacteria bacterium]